MTTLHHHCIYTADVFIKIAPFCHSYAGDFSWTIIRPSRSLRLPDVSGCVTRTGESPSILSVMCQFAFIVCALSRDMSYFLSMFYHVVVRPGTWCWNIHFVEALVVRYLYSFIWCAGQCVTNRRAIILPNDSKSFEYISFSELSSVSARIYDAVVYTASFITFNLSSVCK